MMKEWEDAVWERIPLVSGSTVLNPCCSVRDKWDRGCSFSLSNRGILNVPLLSLL